MERLRVAALGAFGPHGTAATSFEEGCLHRLGDTGHLVVVAMVGLDAVDKQCHLLLVAGRGQEIVNPHDSSLHIDAHEPFLLQHLELGAQGVAFVVKQGGEERHAGPLVQAVDVVDNIAHRMAFYLNARDGREGAADTGKQQFQVFV